MKEVGSKEGGGGFWEQSQLEHIGLAPCFLDRPSEQSQTETSRGKSKAPNRNDYLHE